MGTAGSGSLQFRAVLLKERTRLESARKSKNRTRPYYLVFWVTLFEDAPGPVTYSNAYVLQDASHGLLVKGHRVSGLLYIVYAGQQCLRPKVACHEVDQGVVDVSSRVAVGRNAQVFDTTVQSGGVLLEVLKEASVSRL